MKTLPVQVHTDPFSKKYDMNRTGVHIAPAKRCCYSPIVINSLLKKECDGFSNVSVLGVHIEKIIFKTHHFQINPFSVQELKAPF